ncbi:alginate lyase family protein [Mesobacillus campisalis]|uniref:alginate lyase family protein n=1 Tax=Mesobacillus campisalis TaxID=1408103 RepID=UPI00069C02DC|nr:alginate lyase family protein [Mesobacillus campisalis]
MDKVEDTFVLYRIIGNDLYPRHRKGQTRENLKFVLENEPKLEDCEKRWVVNRIIDREEEEAIIKLLQEHNQKYIHLPFYEGEYQRIGWDTNCFKKPGFLATKEFENLNAEQKNNAIAAAYRLKNNYVMNVNGARNIALRDGKMRAKWVLPWDGNCFITSSAWDEIRKDIGKSPYLKYFAVPMARVLDNSQLVSENFTPTPVEEPQLIFRRDSKEEFNERFPYGRRDKVELIWRLGIPGKWDKWKDEPWDQVRSSKSAEEGQFGFAGWVARMFSGKKVLEKDTKQSFKQRGLARTEAIINTIRAIDREKIAKRKSGRELLFYQMDILEEEKSMFLDGAEMPLITRLLDDAEEALTREPYSVTDKKSLPPSGIINDYWHPAPYWWPNKKKNDGLPYVRRDGRRVPGTKLYEPESDKYDRTRLQRVFDDSITLALAWFFTGKKKYAEHGSRILYRFFVNPATKMNPHLKYAQVRKGRNNNQGTSKGIIEMKDIYFYLDAVRLFCKANTIPEEHLVLFKGWLSSYLDWLINSPQGKGERLSDNNHGTYYDLQVAAISDFLEDYPVLFEAIVRAQSRIETQFAPDGAQPKELVRTQPAHYCCFNLQGWIYMTEIAERYGTDLWAYQSRKGSNLIKAVQWLLSHAGKKWPDKLIDEFDEERYLPIWFYAPQESRLKLKKPFFHRSKYSVKTRFFPHDGVRPYWNIGKAEVKRNYKFVNKHPSFVFGIPLRAKTVSKDWKKVCENLETTLYSLSRQKNKNFVIYLAAHEYPPVNYFGLDVRVLLAPFPVPKNIKEIGRDKGRKKQMIGTALRQSGYESLYYMHLDADDILDPSLVETVLKDDNKRGYLITKGYMYDVRNKLIARCNSFWRKSGSCAIMYFKKDEFPLHYKDRNNYFSKFVRHKNFKTVAEEYGRKLEPLTGRMAVYMVNHGENTRKYRGKGNRQQAYVKKNQIKNRRRIQKIRKRFPELF